MQTFSPEIVGAVVRHMNSDHREDNLVIVRANGAPGATHATMTALDSEAGVWSVVTGESATEVRVDWSIPVTERADIRKAVVLLYRSACSQLGITPRTD
jgi:hypothetical protein